MYLNQFRNWLRTGQPGFDPQQEQSIFPLASASKPSLGQTQPPIQWITGSLPGGKAGPGRDAHHSPLSRAEVKHEYQLYLSPQAPTWRVAEQLYFLLYSMLKCMSMVGGPKKYQMNQQARLLTTEVFFWWLPGVRFSLDSHGCWSKECASVGGKWNRAWPDLSIPIRSFPVNMRQNFHLLALVHSTTTTSTAK